MANELGYCNVTLVLINIIPMTMQTLKILQAVVLMMIVALAASCASSNQYVSKLFGPRPAGQKDTTATVKFLELESLENQDGWVKTDTIRIKKDVVADSTAPVVEDPVAKSGGTETRMPVVQSGTRNKRSRE